MYFYFHSECFFLFMLLLHFLRHPQFFFVHGVDDDDRPMCYCCSTDTLNMFCSVLLFLFCFSVFFLFFVIPFEFWFRSLLAYMNHSTHTHTHTHSLSRSLFFPQFRIFCVVGRSSWHGGVGMGGKQQQQQLGGH